MPLRKDISFHLKRGWKSYTITLVIVLFIVQTIDFKFLTIWETLSHEYFRETSLNLEKERFLQSVNFNRSLDASKEFYIFPFLVPARETPQYLDLTIISQCSPSRLINLDQLSRRWNGFISVALFVWDDREASKILDIIFSLRICIPQIAYRTTMHVVTPISLDFRKPTSVNFLSCESVKMELQSLELSTKNYDLPLAYPVNLLRNVARMYSFSQFILVIDVDMLPSNGLREQFSDLFLRQPPNKHIVYVLPTFEISDHLTDDEIPKNKTMLMSLVKVQDARPFYIDVCWKCQRYTNFKLWLELPPDQELTISYEVDWAIPWEPFFVSSKDIPEYDERFRSYGFNRISHLCELYVSGYDFVVVNPAFLMHRGFKRMDSFHPKKDTDQERNRILFRKFKSTLKDKYPLSSRSCN